MRQLFLKTGLAVALFAAVPGVAQADIPNLSGYASGSSFFSPVGAGSFSVEFLFGRAAQSSTLFYQVNDGAWSKILSTTGNFPGATNNPAPGTVFSGLLLPGVAVQKIEFALCNGVVATFAACTAPGPFESGPGSTNVRTLTMTQWNTEAFTQLLPGEGAMATQQTVFGFEDQVLAGSDRDYNDVVFATTLTTNVVPEPSSVLLMAAGLLGLAGVARRRKQNS